MEGLNLIKPYAKVLGPLGLFPNSKSETLIQAKDTGRSLVTELRLSRKPKEARWSSEQT